MIIRCSNAHRCEYAPWTRIWVHHAKQDIQVENVVSSSATTVLSSVTLRTYRGQFDWQNIVFINIYGAGETNLLPIKSHVTIKCSSISMTLYWDFLTLNRNQLTCFEW